MSYDAKHEDYILGTPLDKHDEAYANREKLEGALGVKNLFVVRGQAGGFKMVEGMSEASLNKNCNVGHQYDKEKIFSSEGKEKAYELSERYFNKLVDNREKLSRMFFDHAFYLTAIDGTGRRRTVAAGYSPYLAEELVIDDKASADAVYAMAEDLGETAFSTFDEKYSVLVLPPSYSLYYPGKTATILFFKRDWLEEQGLEL